MTQTDAQITRPDDCTQLFALYELRGLKSHRGHDCISFSASIHREGKVVGTALNDGNGGCHHVDFFKSIKPSRELTDDQLRMVREAEAQFQAATALVPARELYDPEKPANVDDLIDALLVRIDMDRKSKTKTVGRFWRPQLEHEFFVYNQVLTPEQLRQVIQAQFTPEQRASTDFWITGRGWVTATTLLKPQ